MIVANFRFKNTTKGAKKVCLFFIQKGEEIVFTSLF
jgi:hypothetical protein